MRFPYALCPVLLCIFALLPGICGICVIRTRGCNRNNVVCAAKGNICMKFRNRCQMNLQNCQETNGQYSVVKMNLCRTSNVGVSQMCSNGNNNNNFLSNLGNWGNWANYLG